MTNFEFSNIFTTFVRIFAKRTMEPKKVLFISQEIMPYLPETEMSYVGRLLPQGVLERGKDIRTFMPKFGGINERRNQLHEVIRLSGANLIIDGVDHPLLIKVASIQAARMQVYFIDNEEYYTRKGILNSAEDGTFFDDNDERAIFFTRGIFETVKKLQWNPDLIYCQGWFSSLVTLYLKKEYANDPAFSKAKIVYSCYDDQFEGSLDSKFASKMVSDNISLEDVAAVKEPTHLNINKMAIDYADGIIIHSPQVSQEVIEYAKSSGKPMTSYTDRDTYVETYDKFFDSILEQ